MLSESKPVIFVVDDDEIFSFTLERYIAKNPKVRVKTFLSGDEAVKNLNLNPDIVFLDYYLNGQNPFAKNGMEILEEIKAINPGTKVIILSGQEDGAPVYKFLSKGANNYLIKDKKVFNEAKEIVDKMYPMYVQKAAGVGEWMGKSLSKLGNMFSFLNF